MSGVDEDPFVVSAFIPPIVLEAAKENRSGRGEGVGGVRCKSGVFFVDGLFELGERGRGVLCEGEEVGVVNGGYVWVFRNTDGEEDFK